MSARVLDSLTAHVDVVSQFVEAGIEEELRNVEHRLRNGVELTDVDFVNCLTILFRVDQESFPTSADVD